MQPGVMVFSRIIEMPRNIPTSIYKIQFKQFSLIKIKNIKALNITALSIFSYRGIYFLQEQIYKAGLCSTLILKTTRRQLTAIHATFKIIHLYIVAYSIAETFLQAEYNFLQIEICYAFCTYCVFSLILSYFSLIVVYWKFC